MSSVPLLFDLAGRNALVTGSSRGLGLQIAKALGEAGAHVVLTSRMAGDLRAAAYALSNDGHSADWIAADMLRDDDISALVDTALERCGHIDILINNAGGSWGAPAENYPTEGWDRVFNLNMRSQFIITREIGKRSMIPRGYGRVVNMASIGGLLGTPPDTMQALAYNSSKGALVNFTRALAAEWGHYGITVNALAPGFFPSKLTKGLIKAVGEAHMTARVPLHRLGSDNDLAGPALLFASDAGQHITGQILAVDGGATCVY